MLLMQLADESGEPQQCLRKITGGQVTVGKEIAFIQLWLQDRFPEKLSVEFKAEIAVHNGEPA